MTEGDIQESIHEHESRNAQLLRHIAGKGVGLGEVRAIEHHFWARTQKSAVSLANELYRQGYLVLAVAPTPAADGVTLWNVEASIDRRLEDAGSNSVSEELVRLAAEFDSSYDGWGTTL